MTTVAVALGSNLGDRKGNLRFALEGMAQLGRILAVSNLYETAPVGGPEQDAYLNAVAVLDTKMSAERFLLALHDIEHLRGRERLVRWGPRTLDLDLLLYGSETLTDDLCTVPHPRMLERRFVLEPLVNAWPEAALPDGTVLAGVLGRVADQEVADLGPWWSPPSDEGGFGERGGWWVIAQVGVIGAVALALGLGGPELPGGTLSAVIGAFLALGGLVQSVLGLLQLGDRLTPFPEPLDGGGIIHGGVYSAVRHPIYGGIVVGMVGAALVQRSVVGLLLSLAAGGFFWLKAGREEERLIRRFSHYADYQETTRARLVPWIL